MSKWSLREDADDEEDDEREELDAYGEQELESFAGALVLRMLGAVDDCTCGGPLLDSEHFCQLCGLPNKNVEEEQAQDPDHDTDPSKVHAETIRFREEDLENNYGCYCTTCGLKIM